MEDIVNFFKDRKNLINILTFGILILGLPVGIQLARTQQILFSKAAQAAVEFVEGNCVVTRNSKLVATCEKVAIKLVAPWPAPPQANSPAKNKVSEVNMSFVKTAYAEGSECYSDFECPWGESCIDNVCSTSPASCTPNWQETNRGCISCNTARVFLSDGCGNTDIRDMPTYYCSNDPVCQEVIATPVPDNCISNWQEGSRSCISCNTARINLWDGCGNTDIRDVPTMRGDPIFDCSTDPVCGEVLATPTPVICSGGQQPGTEWDGDCSEGGQRTHFSCDWQGSISFSLIGDSSCQLPSDQCQNNDECGPNGECITRFDGVKICRDVPRPTPGCTPVCGDTGQVCQDQSWGDQCGGLCWGTKNCSGSILDECQNNDQCGANGECVTGNDGIKICRDVSIPTPTAAYTGPYRGVECSYPQQCDAGGGNMGVQTCMGSVASSGMCEYDSARDPRCSVCRTTGSGGPNPTSPPRPTAAAPGPGGGQSNGQPTAIPSRPLGGNPTSVPTRPAGTGGTRCGPDICTGSQVCVRDQFSGELGCQAPTPTRPAGGVTIPVASPTVRPTSIPIATATVGPLTPTGPNCYVGTPGNVTAAQANCVIGMRSDILSFYQSNNWCTQSVNYPGIVNNWYNAVADSAGKAQVASCFGGNLSSTPGPSVSGNPTNTPPPANTPTLANTPSPTPVPIYTVAFRVGEESGSYGDWIGYTQEPVVFNYQFKNVNSGKKFIFAQYKDNLGNLSREYSTNIDFVGADPQLSSLDCKVDLTGSGLAFTLTGANFGVDEGTVSANNSSVEINSWKADSVVARLANPGFSNSQNGQKYRVVLTRKDGQTATQDCRVGTATIALGAKYFCRAPSAQTTQNVKVTLIENVPSAKPVRETVSIDQEGNIAGLKTVIQEGHSYSLGVKVPKALRKAVTFLGSAGTTILPNFNIPVGDIYPSGDGDNAINSNDYAQLVREWGTKFNAGSRPGDFNLDGAVNSFDYACMRDNINKSADEEPVTPLVVQAPPPAVTVAPTTPPSKTTPTPTCSPRPACLDATPPCKLPQPAGGWCATVPTPLPDMTSCTIDNDCDCGTNVITKQCAVGKKEYIDNKLQCPDFCTGIDGRQTVKCVNQVCKVVPGS